MTFDHLAEKHARRGYFHKSELNRLFARKALSSRFLWCARTFCFARPDAGIPGGTVFDAGEIIPAICPLKARHFIPRRGSTL